MIATDHQPRPALARDANVKDWEGQDDRANRITPSRARNASAASMVSTVATVAPARLGSGAEDFRSARVRLRCLVTIATRAAS
jgi:hypothetical protein